MALPELIKRSVESKLSTYCDRKIPREIRDELQLTYKLRGNTATLIERRPHFRDRTIWTEVKVAQLRFDPDAKRWSLYCSDRNGRWHFYDDAPPSANLDDLIAELDRDPTCIFWG